MNITWTDDATTAARPRQRRPWSHSRIRSIVWQVIVVAAVSGTVAMVVWQTAVNLELRGLTSGFEFLHRAAGFEITPGPLSYSSRDTYARALEVGLVNTLRIAALGIVLATALGVVIGIARLSTIWVVAQVSAGYVELIRNTPLLLQLMFWYALSQALPGPRDALTVLPGVFLCSRGLYLPALTWHGGAGWLGGALLTLAILVAVVLSYSRSSRERTGHGLQTIWRVAGGAVILVSIAATFGRALVTIERPGFAGFDFHGGLAITPEFAAVLIGLSTYTAAFIGEIVRAGVLAIDLGQTEAATALGLARSKVLRLVVVPQALRVIIPPLTSQYLNLTKNSSLAVAIGYPDLISITNSSLNQTGQAIESIAVATACYLTISLITALAMNFYNAAIARRGQEGRR